jgi:hypothetical protein
MEKYNFFKQHNDISTKQMQVTSHSPERKSDFAAQAWYLSAL